MQAVRVNLVPILGGHIMTERVQVAVACNLRIAGGAGREEHYHGILSLCAVLRAVEMGTEERVFVVKCSPAFAGAVDRNLDLHSGACRCSDVRLLRRVSGHGTEDCLYACGLETVLEVMCKQLVRRRDCDCAELVQCKHRDPELIMAAKNEHDAVALLDA